MCLVTFFVLLSVAYDFHNGEISVSTVSLGLLDLFSIFLSIYQARKLRHKVFVHYQYDRHFVDRDNEREQIIEFIKSKSNSVLAITGCQGLGKSHLMKTMSDILNFSSAFWTWHFCAVYSKFQMNRSIQKEISETLSLDENSTIEDICRQTKKLKKLKCWVFFIDDIPPEHYIEAIELVEAILCFCPKYKFILGITKLSSEGELEPSRFSIEEVKMVEKSYKVQLENTLRKDIVDNTYGLPVYIRFLIESYSKGVLSATHPLSDMGIYIKKIIDNNLSDEAKNVLSSIIGFLELSNSYPTIIEIKHLDSNANDFTINELYRYSLVYPFNGLDLYIENSISNLCKEVISTRLEKAYYRIYTHYKYDALHSHISLRAYLRIMNPNSIDFQFIKKELHFQYEKANTYYFLQLGRDYQEGKINYALRFDEEVWLTFWFYYFEALLTLGLYPEARTALDMLDTDNYMSQSKVNSVLSFQVHFIMIDLDHLTNHFLEAIAAVELLEQATSDANHRKKCLYLQAHCLKHLGEDLPLAESIFSQLATDSTNNLIDQSRALYSLISIHMFWNDNNFNYDKAFKTINKNMQANLATKKVRPNMNRHYAIYLHNRLNNPKKALSILKHTIIQLEKTPHRIKYDYYFELGEWYRKAYQNQHKEEYYHLGRENIIKSMTFSDRVGDYNLASMSRMSLVLLEMEKDPESKNRQTREELLLEIIRKTRSSHMLINHSYAQFILSIVRREKVSQQLIDYWQRMQYMLLVQAAKAYNAGKKYELTLFVM